MDEEISSIIESLEKMMTEPEPKRVSLIEPTETEGEANRRMHESMNLQRFHESLATGGVDMGAVFIQF